MTRLFLHVFGTICNVVPQSIFELCCFSDQPWQEFPRVVVNFSPIIWPEWEAPPRIAVERGRRFFLGGGGVSVDSCCLGGQVTCHKTWLTSLGAIGRQSYPFAGASPSKSTHGSCKYYQYSNLSFQDPHSKRW